MNLQARTALLNLYAQERGLIARDPELCERMLRERCPDCKREVAVLVGAVRCGVPAEIAASPRSEPRHKLRQRLASIMTDEGGYQGDAAFWAVDAWLDAFEGSALDGPPALPSTPTLPEPTLRKGPEFKPLPTVDPPSNSGPAEPPQRPTLPPEDPIQIGRDPKVAVPLPPPEPVVAAFRQRQIVGHRETSNAQAYVRRALAGGKTTAAVIAELVAAGYPQHVAEAVLWTASLSEVRSKRMTEAFGSFGIALFLILTSAWTAAKVGSVATLGGWATVAFMVFGVVRLFSALSVPNFEGSFRQALSGK